MPTNVLGFGTMFVGERDYGPDGSHITTEFITAILPLIPLRSFRVVETGHAGGASTGYSKTTYVTQRQPLCWAQVSTVYTTMALSIGSYFLLFVTLGNRNKPGSLYGLYQYAKSPIGASVLLGFPLWPLIMNGVLRVKAKRRACMRAWPPF